MRKLCSQPTQLILIGLWLAILFGGCAPSEKHSVAGTRHSLIDYWPPPKNNQQLRLAVKDNIDIKGVVTSAGSEYVAKTNLPASHDADCVAIARQRNARIIGKTNLSEFALAPSGLNDYFGTPVNRYNKPWHHRIPGGSSSGSAVAVADGIADVGFGTDTAGSIRVPAACCGIVGLKTTFGLVSLKGVFPIEPKHLDTVGPMGRDIAHVMLGMDLLEKGFSARYNAAVRAKPSGKQIKAAILLGSLVYPIQYRAALRRRAEWQHTLNRVFEEVDFIALSTLQVVPPRIPSIGKGALLEARMLNLQNTVAVNFAGNPALALPVPVRHEHFPFTSLQLVGPRFSEAELLNAGRLVEAQTRREGEELRDKLR